MSKMPLVTAFLSIIIAIPAMPASADGPKLNTPGVIPAVLTAQQLLANQQKIALATQVLAKQSAPGTVHTQSDSGSAYANIYKEPQADYAINWCGAGTATVLIAGWQIKTRGYDSVGQYSRYSSPGYGTSPGTFTGGDAFMQHLAYDLHAVQDNGAAGAPITEPSRDRTQDYSDEAHVASAANTETAAMTPWMNWYVVWQNMGSLGNFDTALRYDVGNYQVPFSAVAKAAPAGQPALPGWSGAPSSMFHWVAVGQFDILGDSLTYGDSASVRQAYGGDPWYWHYFTRSSFFGSYMLPYMNGAVVW
jgi:hypothetical protein